MKLSLSSRSAHSASSLPLDTGNSLPEMDALSPSRKSVFLLLLLRTEPKLPNCFVFDLANLSAPRCLETGFSDK